MNRLETRRELKMVRLRCNMARAELFDMRDKSIEVEAVGERLQRVLKEESSDAWQDQSREAAPACHSAHCGRRRLDKAGTTRNEAHLSFHPFPHCDNTYHHELDLRYTS